MSLWILLAVLTGLLPGTVTTLRVVAATDTSLVLSWTEVSTAGTGIAKYVVRYDTTAGRFGDWGSEPIPKVLRWAQHLTDHQVVLLASEFSRTLANPGDVDPGALRAILERFIVKVPA